MDPSFTIKFSRSISKDDFGETHFPPYCSGSAFILTPNMARMNAEAYTEVVNVDDTLWIDDVFLTGQEN